MRKVFTLPEGVVTRGRIFLALPGYGEVSVNGRRVDDPDTGSRMLSQYDVRMLYVRSPPRGISLLLADPSPQALPDRALGWS